MDAAVQCFTSASDAASRVAYELNSLGIAAPGLHVHGAVRGWLQLSGSYLRSKGRELALAKHT